MVIRAPYTSKTSLEADQQVRRNLPPVRRPSGPGPEEALRDQPRHPAAPFIQQGGAHQSRAGVVEPGSEPAGAQETASRTPTQWARAGGVPARPFWLTIDQKLLQGGVVELQNRAFGGKITAPDPQEPGACSRRLGP